MPTADEGKSAKSARPDEVELIKDAFEKYDKGGGGKITRESLAKLFRTLDSEEWTDEDLKDLFNLVDTTESGFLQYNKFINYVMLDDDSDPIEETHDEHDHADQIEQEEVLADVPIDLKQLLNRRAYIKLAVRLGESHEEAQDTFHHIENELKANGEDVGNGVPLEEFLEGLHIVKRDKEALQHLSDTLADVRNQIANGASDTPRNNTLAKAIGIDKIVRTLFDENRPIEDAWAIFSEDKVPLSRASKAAVRDMSKAELLSKVKECSDSPIVLPSPAGQAANRENCVAQVNEIIQRCKANGSKYTDPDWDLTKDPREVLYVDRRAPGYDCTVGKPHSYKRLTELIGSHDSSGGGSSMGLMAMLAHAKQAMGGPVLMKGDHVQEGDIIQGQIGTCFLLGAIGSVIASNDKIVKSWFIKYDVDVGVYGVRFNVDGEWAYVIVDDIMPVNAYGELLYASSKDKHEVWCCLMEKAFCKLHTCYEMCDGGRPAEAIFSFFGGVGGTFMIEKKHHRNPKSYFKVLKQAHDRGWLLTTGFNPPDASAMSGQGKCGEAVLESGLVGGHVYSVIDLVEAHGQSLLKIRNPWGTGEWLGKWSDKNRFGEWTEEMVKACNKKFVDDGTFWMSVEDFVKDSTGANFSRTFNPKWKKCTHYKRFTDNGDLTATALWTYKAGADDEIGFQKGDVIDVQAFHKGWWYGHLPGKAKSGFFPGNYVELKDRPIHRFDIRATPDAGKSAVKCVVLLMQQNVMMKRKFYKRKSDGLNYKDTQYPKVELTCVGPNGKIVWQKSGKRREIYGEISVAAGETFSVYCLEVDGRGDAFVLRVYMQDGTVTCSEAPNAHISEVTAAQNK